MKQIIGMYHTTSYMHVRTIKQNSNKTPRTALFETKYIESC